MTTKKETFFTTLGLLFTRQVTLAKAADFISSTKGGF
jgi:hypothetical protein